MMVLLNIFSFCLVIAAIGHVRGIIDDDVCTIPEESNGPIPPVIPTNFYLKGEFIDHLNKTAFYNEMYFDHIRSRGKYIMLIEGKEKHVLLDYKTQQVLEYEVVHPGVDIKRDILSQSCTAMRIEDSIYSRQFGIVDNMYLEPKMFTSNQAMKFGGLFPYAFNGSQLLPSRGIKTNKFIGCVWERYSDIYAEATSAMEYYFTDKEVAPPGGTYLEDINGAFGLLSVPVKATYNGVITVKYYENVTEVPFNGTENFLMFVGEPEYEYSTFQIPPWMHCNGYRGQMDMPKFPEGFSTRLEVNSLEQDQMGHLLTSEVTSYQEIYYSHTQFLARRDYTPDPSDHDDATITEALGPQGFVRTIYDYRTGIVYTSHRASGRCYLRSLKDDDYFGNAKNLLGVIMGTPEEVFHIGNENMEYKGRGLSRDFECDVWSGISETEDFMIFKETYIAADGWHENSDDLVSYAIPVKHSIIVRTKDESLAEQIESVKEFNFLKFKSREPPLIAFDVSNCIEQIDHKFLAIMLNVEGEKAETLKKFQYFFLDVAQLYLTNVSQVNTPLRVQRIHLRTIKEKLALVFALVDKPRFAEDSEHVEHGADLDDATVNLQTAINDETFIIRFFLPTSKELLQVPARPGSLYISSPEGKLSFIPQKPSNETVKIQDQDPKNRIMYEDPKDAKKEVRGMSPGSLAGLSFAMLFIGIGVGIALMYLYIRKFTDQALDSLYAMETRSASRP